MKRIAGWILLLVGGLMLLGLTVATVAQAWNDSRRLVRAPAPAVEAVEVIRELPAAPLREWSEEALPRMEFESRRDFGFELQEPALRFEAVRTPTPSPLTILFGLVRAAANLLAVLLLVGGVALLLWRRQASAEKQPPAT